MEIKDILNETLSEMLKRISLPYLEIDITEEENNNYYINLKSDNPSELIGYHGENIQALQHLLKILAWKKSKTDHFNILLDVDNYRKRQEDTALNLAIRKIAQARKSGRPQILPPMSPFLRRKIHLYCMGAGHEDIETYSEGDGDNRHLVIKLK